MAPKLVNHAAVSSGGGQSGSSSSALAASASPSPLADKVNALRQQLQLPPAVDGGIAETVAYAVRALGLSAQIDGLPLAERVDACLEKLGVSYAAVGSADLAQQASQAARRLVKAQTERLPGILRGIRAAGSANYVKHDHWAWYVFPTSKEGISDPCSTAVKGRADIQYVLASHMLLDWTAILEALATALRERGSRRVFPSIDHGRIDYFIREWSDDTHLAQLESAPQFAAAVAEFAKAWEVTASKGASFMSMPRWNQG